MCVGSVRSVVRAPAAALLVGVAALLAAAAPARGETSGTVGQATAAIGAPPAPAAVTPEPGAPVPAAAPAPAPAVAPAPVTPPASPADAVEPARTRRRPNLAIRAARLPDTVVDAPFGGRVGTGETRVSGCSTSDACEQVDYVQEQVVVRAEAGDEPAIVIERARTRGRGAERAVEIEVTFRPRRERAVSTTVSVPAGADALEADFDPDAARALAQVRDDLGDVLAPGGALEGLGIFFQPGDVVAGSTVVVVISAADEPLVIRAEVPAATRPRLPRPTAVRKYTAQAPTPARPGAQRRQADELAEEVLGLAVAPPPTTGGQAVAEAGPALVGALFTGACQAVGGCGDEPPPFFVDALTAVLYVDEAGVGELNVRCPPGYDDVAGEVVVDNAPGPGEARTRFSSPTPFPCDGTIVPIRVRLNAGALGDLRAFRQVTIRVTVVLRGPDDLRVEDADLAALVFSADRR